MPTLLHCNTITLNMTETDVYHLCASLGG